MHSRRLILVLIWRRLAVLLIGFFAMATTITTSAFVVVPRRPYDYACKYCSLRTSASTRATSHLTRMRKICSSDISVQQETMIPVFGGHDCISRITVPPFAKYTNKDDEDVDSTTTIANNNNNYPSRLHHIYLIQDLLTTDAASKFLELARNHAAATACWDQPDTSRHASYATCDFAVDDCPELQEYLDQIHFEQGVLDTIRQLYQVNAVDFMDLFCVRYVANSDLVSPPQQQTKTTKTMNGLESHRDGSLISFTVLLNSPDSFTGGGTYFDALRNCTLDDEDNNRKKVLQDGAICLPQAGHACLHSGKLLHGGHPITSGERIVLVGFVNVYEERPGVLAKACRDWGRLDAALWRYRKQDQMRRRRWNTQQTSWSRYTGNHVPIFSSTKRRADPEYQRLKRLEIEDLLLRNVLLDPVENSDRIVPMDLFDGDVSVCQ